MLNPENEPIYLSQMYIQYPDGTVKLARIRLEISDIENLEVQLNDINTKLKAQQVLLDNLTPMDGDLNEGIFSILSKVVSTLEWDIYPAK